MRKRSIKRRYLREAAVASIARKLRRRDIRQSMGAPPGKRATIMHPTLHKRAHVCGEWHSGGVAGKRTGRGGSHCLPLPPERREANMGSGHKHCTGHSPGFGACGFCRIQD